MDESWRMHMGMPGRPRRRSMEERAAGTTRRTSMEVLNPDDFADVFGGPPRSILSRKFSGDFTRSSSASFYEEIFRQSSEFVTSSLENKKNGGRSLPAFRIPGNGDGFYSDVFGWEDGRRSRDRSRPNSKAKSKSNSSSVLSSEDLSPHRRPLTGADDVALSSFTSKLRWNSTTVRPEQLQNKDEMPYFPGNYDMENGYNDYFRSSHIKVSRQTSPETISLDPTSHRSIKVPVDELEEGNSPASSPVSSISQEVAQENAAGNTMQEEDHRDMELYEDEEDEDEVMSSYVIEINSSDHREVASSEAISIDEAIAWAKEKFHSQDFDTKDHSSQLQERPNTVEHRAQQNDGSGRTPSSPEEDLKKQRSEEEQTEQSERDMELQILDEEIRMWSAGKETNIRMLLSTLHHILWPNSSWFATPLTSLIESSQVKKAYQKARLCLHPDKLQQRGATTLRQKYVAEKAFSILQDAWAAFISQDVFFN